MKFWVTTHWAPRKDAEQPSYGVWVADGKEGAGDELRKNDYVLIYQLGGGPVELREAEHGTYEKIGRQQGGQGIVAITQARQDFGENGDKEAMQYVRRKPIWWRWGADTELISRNGFVPVNELNKVLGYDPGYRMRGFGDGNSGLKEITEGQYNKLVKLFRACLNNRKTPIKPHILLYFFDHLPHQTGDAIHI